MPVSPAETTSEANPTTCHPVITMITSWAVVVVLIQLRSVPSTLLTTPADGSSNHCQTAAPATGATSIGANTNPR